MGDSGNASNAVSVVPKSSSAASFNLEDDGTVDVKTRAKSSWLAFAWPFKRQCKTKSNRKPDQNVSQL